MVFELFLNWGCIEVLNCKVDDLSNITATYIGIIAGFVLGGLVTWWVYNRQEKTASKQNEILTHITELEEAHKLILEKHEVILEKVQIFEQNHDEILKNIFTLETKINSLLENKQ